MKDTDELMNDLNEAKDIKSFLAENGDELRNIDLKTYLAELLKKKNLTRADVVKNSGMDKSYAYHIIDGTRKNPGRDKVLALAFGFKADLKEAQRMLYYAGKNLLYPRSARDSMIMMALKQGSTIMETDELLFKFQEEVIIKENDSEEKDK